MTTLEDVKVLGIGSELFADMEDENVEGDVVGDDDTDEDDEEDAGDSDGAEAE